MNTKKNEKKDLKKKTWFGQKKKGKNGIDFKNKKSKKKRTKKTTFMIYFMLKPSLNKEAKPNLLPYSYFLRLGFVF